MGRIVVANADGTGHRDLRSPSSCGRLIWSPDSTYLLGRIGGDCTVLTRITVDDPAKSIKIRVPGEMAGQMSWQRIAP